MKEKEKEKQKQEGAKKGKVKVATAEEEMNGHSQLEIAPSWNHPSERIDGKDKEDSYYGNSFGSSDRRDGGQYREDDAGDEVSQLKENTQGSELESDPVDFGADEDDDDAALVLHQEEDLVGDDENDAVHEVFRSVDANRGEDDLKIFGGDNFESDANDETEDYDDDEEEEYEDDDDYDEDDEHDGGRDFAKELNQQLLHEIENPSNDDSDDGGQGDDADDYDDDFADDDDFAN